MFDTHHFEDRLRTERERAMKTLGWADDEFKNHDHSVQDAMPDSGDNETADSATDTLTMELDSAYRRRASSRVNAIDAALQRLKLGQFGTCVHCGKEIAKGRLETIPWAPYCMDCARELEVQD